MSSLYFKYLVFARVENKTSDKTFWYVQKKNIRHLTRLFFLTKEDLERHKRASILPKSIVMSNVKHFHIHTVKKTIRDKTGIFACVGL